ncbi:MAG: hypothetical protein JJU29_14065 [Verrucomicrobia bacterium]|nr:hypothetical protein [Verrucomicrobiota bacterium]MCH8512188.1 hypothetical protein [Kiritimatiellia bacterium]
MVHFILKTLVVFIIASTWARADELVLTPPEVQNQEPVEAADGDNPLAHGEDHDEDSEKDPDPVTLGSGVGWVIRYRGEFSRPEDRVDLATIVNTTILVRPEKIEHLHSSSGNSAPLREIRRDRNAYAKWDYLPGSAYNVEVVDCPCIKEDGSRDLSDWSWKGVFITHYHAVAGNPMRFNANLELFKKQANPGEIVSENREDLGSPSTEGKKASELEATWSKDVRESAFMVTLAYLCPDGKGSFYNYLERNWLQGPGDRNIRVQSLVGETGMIDGETFHENP